MGRSLNGNTCQSRNSPTVGIASPTDYCRGAGGIIEGNDVNHLKATKYGGRYLSRYLALLTGIIPITFSIKIKVLA